MLCPCGHTFEVHDRLTGCERCGCERDRTHCLNAAIDIARHERTPYPQRVRSKPNELPTIGDGV